MSEITQQRIGDAMVFTLPDGSRVTMSERQRREFLDWATGRRDPTGRGRDQQEMLLNFQKYGVFVPTADDFAAYRARRDALKTSPDIEDAQTGYASVDTPKLFADLHAYMLELCERAGRKPGSMKLMLEELRRRLAAAPARQSASLYKAETDLKQALAELEAAKQAKDHALNDTEKAKRHQEEYRTRALEDERLVEVLERRIAALKEQLPEEFTASGRAIQL
ncbi:hypothetical protein J2J97_32395 (plasmid) [Rhizobium bangladeshense]|uniref:hypothetical protein n=1 Tax=Rhizobium bangladeshense TaxID=1138189 RepID=UPI001A9998CB|nr:hypothetical protein [Rhizobium bangladeshense]QSY98606.1 hypothetical protein J2J97_32395 [Rhizobium bangladeshense]